MGVKRTLACRDLGMDCKFKVTAKNDQKIEAKIAKHLKKKHKMLEMTHDLRQRAQSMIRDTA
jgi:predicted small metal-binding protein